MLMLMMHYIFLLSSTWARWGDYDDDTVKYNRGQKTEKVNYDAHKIIITHPHFWPYQQNYAHRILLVRCKQC